NATATNYDENATVDNDSCVYPPPPEPLVDDDPPTSTDDGDDEGPVAVESESPLKSGIADNISVLLIALVVILVLLLSGFVLLQRGYRR
ncbi:MAG: hypothetical protein ACKVIR_08380, partial [Candidatus Poseidoniales archaeon]